MASPSAIRGRYTIEKEVGDKLGRHKINSKLKKSIICLFSVRSTSNGLNLLLTVVQ